MFIILLMLTGVQALTSSPPAGTPTDDDPIICTTDPIGSEVGTHMRSKKICMRKSDRDFAEHHNRREVISINNNGNDRQRFIPAPPRPH
jgi:hypothetical protein